LVVAFVAAAFLVTAFALGADDVFFAAGLALVAVFAGALVVVVFLTGLFLGVVNTGNHVADQTLTSFASSELSALCLGASLTLPDGPTVALG
jgi:hypothetical protein